MAELKRLSDTISDLDVRVKETEDILYQKMLCIPNVPNEKVIHGETDEDNKEVRKWGEVPKFDFEAKAHWDIGTDLNILDFASIYYILFPNTFFIFHPDYVSINYFYPVKPDVTIWTHEMYYDKSKFSPDESIRENQLNKRFIFTNDVVFDNEDFLIAEKVQCGIKAEIDAYHTIGKDEGLVYFFQTSIDKYVKG